MKITDFQKFETAVVDRSQIRGAPFNPRKIGDRAKAELKKVIKRVGLIEPIIVNKRTGHVVGGHQRLAILDALEGNHKYSMTVALVDFEEKTEREMNIVLNNPDVQGEWDVLALRSILNDLEVANLGFSADTLKTLFKDADQQVSKLMSSLHLPPKEEKSIVNSVRDALSTPREYRDDTYTDFHMLIVFRSESDLASFKKLVGIKSPTAREIPYETLRPFLSNGSSKSGAAGKD